MDVLHAALNVSDMHATLDFYGTLFGLEQTREAELDGQRMVWVAGESDAELQFLASDEDVEVSGLDHIAIGVDDVDATIEAATTDWGSSVVVEPQVVGDEAKLAFITDPDGYHVELIEELS